MRILTHFNHWPQAPAPAPAAAARGVQLIMWGQWSHYQWKNWGHGMLMPESRSLVHANINIKSWRQATPETMSINTSTLAKSEAM